ncbi:MAG: iron-sulfur cluster repair di-iron protein, ric [Clostridiales bacterium]|nr:iron-sulfur cluster repair di-iron protein, ric [Clostridiales bacterium]
MNRAESFHQAKAKHLKTLAQYVPVVDRVHGKHHPEFHEVRAIAEDVIAKAKAVRTRLPALDEEFIRLRQVTDNYTVPGDVCESYEAVYHMLAELDRAYNA